MADLRRNPIPLTAYGDPGAYVNGSEVTESLIFAGLESYIEAAERTLTATALANSAARFGRHLVCVEDSNIGGNPDSFANVARYMELYTLGDSALSIGFGFSRRLAGKVNSDAPAFATYRGFVGMVDGEGRTRPSGDGREMVVFAQVRGAGYRAKSFNITDDGGAFTTNRTSPTNSFATHTPFAVTAAVNDAEYFAADAPFGVLKLNFIQQTNDFLGTIVWEYFDGASFTALSNVTDATSNFSVSNLGVEVLFDIPLDWATTTINGEGPFYFIRARVSAFTSGTSANILNKSSIAKVLESQPPAVANAPAAPLNCLDDGATDLRVGDVCYFGTTQTFSGVRLTATADGASDVTLVFEYWNGSAWTALAGVTDGTNEFAQATTPQDITWTVPGDWAARQITVVSENQFWMRLRVTVVTTAYTAVQSTTMVIGTLAASEVGIVQGQAPVCFDIGAKPGALGERDPEVIGWGIALPSGIVADPMGLHTYYDPVRKIHSRRFDIAATNNYIPLHGEPAVDTVVKWTNATTSATIEGTSGTGKLFVLDTTTADTNVTIGVDSGPPVFYDETEVDRDFSLQGYAACVLRNRVYVVRDDRIIWSERGEFHQFAPANGIDIAPNDGDSSTQIYAFAEKVIIFKNHHIYALVGEPSVGTIGIQIMELSNEIGCIAKRTVVDVGGQLLFLSQSGIRQVDANALPQPIDVSEPVRDIFEEAIRAKGDLMHQAAAAWEPTKHLYLIAMPGVQQQATDGAVGAGQATQFNDGLMAFCRRNGQWGMWAGQPQAFGCLTTYWRTSHSRAVAAGSYSGLLWSLTDQDPSANPVDTTMGDIGVGLASLPRNGTVDADPAPTIGRIIDAGAFLDETTDTRLIGLPVLILSGPQAGRTGKITRSSVNEIRVDGGVGLLEVGDRYAIGNFYWYADTGDLHWGEPTQERSVRSARPIFNGNPLAQPVDIGVANRSVRDKSATMLQLLAQSFELGGATVTMPVQAGTPRAVALPGRRGLTARLRMAGRIGSGVAFQFGDSKPRIRQLIIDGRTFGRSGGT